ncbi:hypothetical protein RFF73_10150, partial [Streptococcus ruminantium]|nr:hypothetical protein [Streptococcus ruminantium]
MQHAHFQTHSTRLGGYNVHRFQVKLFPRWNTQETEPSFKVNNIKTVILENTEKLPNIEVDLDKSTDLNQANFTVTGARLTDVKK